MKKGKKTMPAVSAAALCLAAAMCVGCGAESASSGSADLQSAQESQDAASSALQTQTLSVQFLKVGKADAMVLFCDGEAMVIDTGEAGDGGKVLNALSAAGVSSVKALILTHFDKDHIGGAAELLEGISVQRVFCPDYEENSDEMQALQDALQRTGVPVSVLTAEETVACGSAVLTLLPPGKSDRSDNDSSIVTLLTFGERKMLFAGDAMETRIAELVQDSRITSGGFDLLKVPHHGTLCGKSAELINAVQPKLAVICCSKKNPPDDTLLSLLTAQGTQVFTTDSGTVTVESNGINVPKVNTNN